MTYETNVKFQTWATYYIDADSKKDAMEKVKERVLIDYKTHKILKICIREKEELEEIFEEFFEDKE